MTPLVGFVIRLQSVCCLATRATGIGVVIGSGAVTRYMHVHLRQRITTILHRLPELAQVILDEQLHLIVLYGHQQIDPVRPPKPVPVVCASAKTPIRGETFR